jgi:hypothetical protein
MKEIETFYTNIPMHKRKLEVETYWAEGELHPAQLKRGALQ